MTTSTILRVFVAILPSEPIFHEVIALQQEISIRFNCQAALNSPPHITLQTPFEVPKQSLPNLRTNLSNFAQRYDEFYIELCGFSTFHPNVIYIKVHPEKVLFQIQSDLSYYLLKTLNIRNSHANDKTFRPHVTIAFKDLLPDNFEIAWNELCKRSYNRYFKSENMTLLIYNGNRWEVDSQLRWRSNTS
jgi:2'-5' RNA ligase